MSEEDTEGGDRRVLSNAWLNGRAYDERRSMSTPATAQTACRACAGAADAVHDTADGGSIALCEDCRQAIVEGEP